MRWPLRLLGVLLLLLLAWQYPWRAYVVVVLGAASGATYIAPYLPFFSSLASPRPVVGGLGALVCLVCWLLPQTTAWLVGLALWGLLGYASWQLCAGATYAARGVVNTVRSVDARVPCCHHMRKAHNAARAPGQKAEATAPGELEAPPFAAPDEFPEA